jgi:hypothetical protein
MSLVGRFKRAMSTLRHNDSSNENVKELPAGKPLDRAQFAGDYISLVEGVKRADNSADKIKHIEGIQSKINLLVKENVASKSYKENHQLISSLQSELLSQLSKIDMKREIGNLDVSKDLQSVPDDKKTQIVNVIKELYQSEVNYNFQLKLAHQDALNRGDVNTAKLQEGLIQQSDKLIGDLRGYRGAAMAGDFDTALKGVATALDSKFFANSVKGFSDASIHYNNMARNTANSSVTQEQKEEILRSLSDNYRTAPTDEVLKSADNATVQSLNITPVQRNMRYGLLINELVKNLPENSDTKETFVSISKMTGISAKSVNMNVDHQEKSKEVEKSTLAQPTRARSNTI